MTGAALPLPAWVICSTSFKEFDRVLGGGVVPGSAILIGGSPGAGKSTLLLQVMCRLSEGMKTLYVTGEESLQQVAMRAHVDTVLQYFRSGQGAIFGDVTDHDDRHTARLGEARQVSGGFTHLGPDRKYWSTVSTVRYCWMAMPIPASAPCAVIKTASARSMNWVCLP